EAMRLLEIFVVAATPLLSKNARWCKCRDEHNYSCDQAFPQHHEAFSRQSTQTSVSVRQRHSQGIYVANCVRRRGFCRRPMSGILVPTSPQLDKEGSGASWAGARHRKLMR